MRHGIGTAAAGLIAALGLAAPAPGGAVLHVDDDAPAGGDGTSWAAAFRFLQDALGAATAGGVAEIRVAGGVYRPDRSAADPQGSGDRAATFALLSGVAVLGGHAGIGAPDPDLRDPAAFPSVLSGDLLGDDAPGFTSVADNSYHVVTASGTDDTARLDGFTVSGGHADGTADATCFGGFNHGMPCGSDADCADGACIGADSIGAGILVVGGTPTLENCRVVGNLAAFQGGGIVLKGGSDAALTGCHFEGNRAGDNGGAMYLGGSAPSVTDCVFLGNSAVNYAGASCNRDHSDANFFNCTFADNTAAEDASEGGGGAIVNASSSPTFTGCQFTNNRSLQRNGGAIYNEVGFFPALGASHPMLEECVFEANEAGQHGGAIYNIGGSSIVVTAGAFTANAAASRGGAVYSAAGTVAWVTQTTFSGNAAAQYGGAVYDVGQSSIFEGCVFDANEVLADYSDGGAVYTAAVDSAFTFSTFSDNAAGRDGGALYGGGSMTVWACTFTGNSSGDDGAALYGGEALLWACTFIGNASGDNGGAVADIVGDVAECAFIGNVAGGGGGAIRAYDPLAVTDCTFSGNDGAFLGGALSLVGTAETAILDSRFEGNTSEFGGAVYANEAQPMIVGCEFFGNTAASWGGVMYNAFSDPVLVNCVCSGNSAGTRGGAVYNFESAPALVNCTLVANTAGLDGGGVFNQLQGDPLLVGSILWANTDGGPVDESAQLFQMTASQPVVNYCCIQGWTGALGGTGNFGDDPLLVDPDGPDGQPGTDDDDLRLLAGSPAIDAGASGALPPDQFDLDGDGDTSEPTPLDLDGQPRLADDPCTADTGSAGGLEDVVDLGAFEFQGASGPPADLDGDCAVGVTDFLALLAVWGPCPDPPADCPADLDGDGAVGVVDFLALLAAWGP